MKSSEVVSDLWRQSKRVEDASALIRSDRRRARIAYRRFMRETVANPLTLLAAGAAGFLVTRPAADGRRSFASRLGSLVSMTLWTMRQWRNLQASRRPDAS